jgi:hypothetical protein
MDLGIKTSIGIAAFLLSVTAHASEIFYSPSDCSPEELIIKIKNTSNEPQRLWTQIRFGDEIDEIQYDLDAKSEMKIKGTEFMPTTSSYSLKTWDTNRLKVLSQCRGLEAPLSVLTSPEVLHYLPNSSAQTVKVKLLNLYLKSNQVTLKAVSRTGKVIAEQALKIEKYYDTASVKWNLPEGASQLEITAENRINSFVTFEANGKENLSPGLPKTVRLPASDAKTYFLVSTKDSRPDEAFVVAMDEPAKIATAREQIKNPHLEKILVAGIELGHGDENRAFLSRDKAPYSWHVSRVDAFADFAHIDCDGSPGLTEERLAQKLNEGGRICFWRYRVVRELTLQEVQSGKLTGKP